MVPHPVSVRLQEQQLHYVMWFYRSRYRDGLDMPACVCGRVSYHSFNEWRHLLRPAVWKFVGWNYWNFQPYARSLQQCELTQCSVTKSRDGTFNIVDKFLQLDEVCSQFGFFVKLLCQILEPASSTLTIAVRNAFDVLMRSQAALSQREKLPQNLRLVTKRISFSMI